MGNCVKSSLAKLKGINMIRIGSRGSKLALWQAHWVKSALAEHFPTLPIEIKIIKTTGDRYQEIAPPEVMPKGLFTKEIQDAMLANEVDLAVHSLKDLATETDERLQLAAITKRENPQDALISANRLTINELPQQARVGTTSTRRKSQLLAVRPDLEVLDLRGNVDTRLRKLDEGQYDAIILAAAGLLRLGLQDRICELIDKDMIVPAVGQGALGLEIRADDAETFKYVSVLNDASTRTACLAERRFLAALGGGCQVPIAAYAQIEDGQFTMQACVASIDGKQVIKEQISGSALNADALAQQLAERLLEAGAESIIGSIKTT